MKKPKRPPRQVWILVDFAGWPLVVTSTRKEMKKYEVPEDNGSRVFGPYVLAERVRQK
jgi:hypothetical protein